MKKNIFFLLVVLFGICQSMLQAQNFSANAKAVTAKNISGRRLMSLLYFFKSIPLTRFYLLNIPIFTRERGGNDQSIGPSNRLMVINPKSSNELIALGTAKISLVKTQEGVDHLTQTLSMQPNLRPELSMRSKAYDKLN